MRARERGQRRAAVCGIDHSHAVTLARVVDDDVGERRGVRIGPVEHDDDVGGRPRARLRERARRHERVDPQQHLAAPRRDERVARSDEHEEPVPLAPASAKTCAGSTPSGGNRNPVAGRQGSLTLLRTTAFGMSVRSKYWTPFGVITAAPLAPFCWKATCPSCVSTGVAAAGRAERLPAPTTAAATR